MGSIPARALTAAVVIAALCVPTAAGIERVRVKSVVEISAMDAGTGSGATGAAGEVRSRRHFCEASRLVTVWKGDPDAGGTKAGFATTDSDGQWAMTFPAQGITDLSNYRATVKRKAKTANGRRIICKPDTNRFGYP